MELYKRRSKQMRLIIAPFMAQFNYCAIVWMFHCRSFNNKINRLHELCLTITYNDKSSSFEELLVKDNSVSIQYNNIHSLTIEMYKIVNGISPEITNDVV